MFSTDLFIKTLDKNKEKKQRFQSIYFGIMFGIVLLFISIFRLITDMNVNNDKFYFILLFISLVDLFLVIFIPSKIKYIEKLLLFVGKMLGTIILSILLIIVYIIWFIPASIISKFISKKDKTTFYPKRRIIIKKANNNIFSQIKGIFSYFLFDGGWYLLPVLLIFIIIGLILFFAQSPAVAPLIYPLI